MSIMVYTKEDFGKRKSKENKNETHDLVNHVFY